MKTLFTAGFAHPGFVALGQESWEPTVMPDTSETGQPLTYMPPAQQTTNPLAPIISSAAKAAIALKFPNLPKTQAPVTTPPAPSNTGTILAVLGGAAALGLGAYLIFRK